MLGQTRSSCCAGSRRGRPGARSTTMSPGWRADGGACRARGSMPVAFFFLASLQPSVQRPRHRYRRARPHHGVTPAHHHPRDGAAPCTELGIPPTRCICPHCNNLGMSRARRFLRTLGEDRRTPKGPDKSHHVPVPQLGTEGGINAFFIGGRAHAMPSTATRNVSMMSTDRRRATMTESGFSYPGAVPQPASMPIPTNGSRWISKCDAGCRAGAFYAIAQELRHALQWASVARALPSRRGSLAGLLTTDPHPNGGPFAQAIRSSCDC